MSEFTLVANRVLLPCGTIGPAAIRCSDGVILDVEPPLGPSHGVDARNLLVLPAIVDLHGDSFERQIHPRPGVGVDIDIALAETDRQMLANGIATAFHGLTVTWEPGTRDLDSARATIAALRRVRPLLGCDTRLHLRHELLSLDTVDAALEWIAGGLIDLLALNDHSDMIERALARPHLPASRLEKISVPEDEYRRMAAGALSRRAEGLAGFERLAAAARARGIPLASHDDETPEARRQYRDLGCRISEFPADVETALAAIAGGDTVVFGGPNILRGGSHCGRVTAAEMICDGLCTALCSDYYYPSVLYAPFRLAAAGVLDFSEAWDLVSRGPAGAAGLDDRGSIEAGRRADLILVDDSDRLHPIVRAVFVAGVPVYTRAFEPAERLELVSL
jgi:alpha-D-ribose 1-methylphosphonate 5-triphosphate diphosphatase